MASFKDTMTSERPVKIELSREMEIEEIYEKMNQRASDFKMPFKLKKGLFGKKIEFKRDSDLELVVTVTVKGNEVTVKPIVQQSQTTVGIGGFEARVDKNSMLRKGFKGVLDTPAERGKRVAETAETIKSILS
ncbi:MAG: hypothetical protein ACI4XI_02390 [Ruminococcus sp.]